MGLDFLFYAAHRDDRRKNVTFVFTRAVGVGQLILSYFSHRAQPRFNEHDTEHAYPVYRITPETWNEFMRKLDSRAALIRYLSGTVTKARDDDPFFPEDVRDIESVDMEKVRAFDRWFSETFFCEPAFKDGVLYMDTEDRCFGVIAEAFELEKWMEMDGEVWRYLLDDSYEVTMRNG